MVLLPHETVLEDVLALQAPDHITVLVGAPFDGIDRLQKFFGYIQRLPGLVPVVMELAVSRPNCRLATEVQFALASTRASLAPSWHGDVFARAEPCVMHSAQIFGFYGIVTAFDRTC